MSVPTIRRLATVAALVTGLAGCGGDDGAGVRELEGDCPASGSASGSETSGSETSGSETSGSETSGSETSGAASAECETTPSSEGSGSQ